MQIQYKHYYFYTKWLMAVYENASTISMLSVQDNFIPIVNGRKKQHIEKELSFLLWKLLNAIVL